MRIYGDGVLRAEYRRGLDKNDLWAVGKIIWDEDGNVTVIPALSDDTNVVGSVENLNYITKYGNEDENTIYLDRLGASSWQKRKAEAKKKIRDASKKLIKIASKRLQSKSLPINIENPEYDKFCSTFPYVETDDQNVWCSVDIMYTGGCSP